jgi:hypothetical protein
MRNRAYSGETLEVCSVRNTLTCIERDVVRCLQWMDLGLSPCACGLLGPTPKPSAIEGPRVPRPSLAEVLV